MRSVKVSYCCAVMNERILVLEDEKRILEIIEIILVESGYDVMAVNRFVPLEYVVEVGAELVILDVRLSNGYGHLLCEDLKTDPATTNIPIILVSGADNLEGIAKDCKADSYLQKPFDINELLSMVNGYSERIEANRKRTLYG